MPGLVSLVTLLSLDVVRGLVASGNAIATLSIVSATNATPVVIETAEPHGIADDGDKPGQGHVVISGMLGNTSPNRIDTNPQSFTVGENLAVVAQRVDDTHLALYSPSAATGLLEPMVGNGNYTGGGTMRGALNDPNCGFGRIFLGKQFVRNHAGPPTIVFVPTECPYEGKDVYHGAASNTAERRRQAQQRSVATARQWFDVHCWGQANPPDPELDFDAAAVLESQVILSAKLIAAGNVELGRGDWPNQSAGALDVAGEYYVFTIGIGIPVVDAARAFAPPSITPVPTTKLQPANNATPPEVSCTG